MNDNSEGKLSRRGVHALLVGIAGGSALAGCNAWSEEPGGEAIAKRTEALSTGARLVMASSLLISPGSTPGIQTTNSQRYLDWRNDTSSSAASTTLVFDQPGTYLFNADTLLVPGDRTLAAVAGVTLKCASNGAWFVSGANPGFTLEDLTLDGSGTVDHVIQSIGSFGSAGPRTTLLGITALNARTTCLHAFNTRLLIRGCATGGAPVGLSLQACEGSYVDRVDVAAHSAAGIRVRGSFGDAALPNPGRITLLRVFATGPGCGLELDGTGGCNVHGITTAGTATSIWVRNKASNSRIFGARLTSGGVDFDGCSNVYLWGGCVTSIKIRYLNDARSCRAVVAAESNVAPVDITQEWVKNSTTWQGYVRPDGTVLSVLNNMPTCGRWEVGDQVYRSNPVTGLALGWICTVAGSPGGFAPLPAIG
jgi:hypothetical protein